MNTYKFSRSVANALNITFNPNLDVSDQELQKTLEISEHSSVPAPQSSETRKAISEACMGRIPPNKGIPNPVARERMIKNNPMFNIYSVRKMAQSKMGKEPSNKIKSTFDWDCKWCNKSHTDCDTVKKRKAANFCGKSCAASYSNTHRYRCD